MCDRTKLAEAMGWKFPHGPTKHCPDPFTDANDCNALIKHLNGLGLELCIVHGIGYARVLLSGGKDRAETFKPLKVGEIGDECDNWMRGVCELALKVIENDRLLKAAQEPCPLA